MRSVVVDGTDDHALCPRKRRAQRRPLQITRVVTLLEILHFAGMPSGDPLGEMIELGKLRDRSDADEFKAGVFRCLFYESFDFADSLQVGGPELKTSLFQHCRPESRRLAYACQSKADALRTIAFTVAEKTEHSSSACSAGIDLEMRIMAVPCVTAHKASPKRVWSSGEPPRRSTSLASMSAMVGRCSLS